MASAAVVDIVNSVLAAGWSATPVYAEDLIGEVPEDFSSFLEVQYPVSNEIMISIGAPGSNCFREEGAVRFVLAVPRGQGVAGAMARIEELRGLFRGYSNGNFLVWEVSPPVLDDRMYRGAYLRLSCIATYKYDVFA